MKLLRTLALYTVTVLTLYISVAQADVVVIINVANNDIINKARIRDIYSDLISQWSNGNAIHIVELSPRSRIREVFSKNVIGISARESASAWANRKITNTMKNAKPKIKRESAAVAAVKRNINAIAYVSDKAIEGQTGIKVLMRIQ